MSEMRIPADFPTPGDVRGRRVVLTGASRGLGRVLAHAFSDAGADLLLVARDAARLRAVAKEVPGSKPALMATDISDPDSNEMIADAAIEHLGGLDVWIANAGISPSFGGPREIAIETWRRILDVNLTGVFLGARAASRVLSPHGRIIVTSSVLGTRPKEGLAAYSVSKAGVQALVASLAQDLASTGVTVNAIALGWFDSPLATAWTTNPEREKEILEHTACQRWGSAADLPGAFLFIASRASDFVTGTTLTVDGGYLTR